MAPRGLLESAMELPQLGISAHELAEAPRGRHLEPRADRAPLLHLVDLYSLTEPLRRHHPARLDEHVPLGQPQGLRGDQDRARRRPLPRALREPSRPADRRVLPVPIGAHGPDHHLARVEADTHRDRRPLRPAGARAELLHRLLHPERGVARTNRVVLLGQRRTEQRRHPVP